MQENAPQEDLVGSKRITDQQEPRTEVGEIQRRTSMVVLEEKEEQCRIEVDESPESNGLHRNVRFQRQRKKGARRAIKDMDALIERDNVNMAKERILINVGGVKHETYRATLKIIPDTRLAWIAENKSSSFEGFDATKNEYFFDRHSGVFGQILNYYRTGKLHSPSDVCGPMFEEELQFWGIDEKQMEPCCWAKYTEHRDAQENLRVFEDPGLAMEDDMPVTIPNYIANEELYPRPKSRATSCFDTFINKIKPAYFDSESWRNLKRKGHTLLEDHRSSLPAKCFTFASLTFIIFSIWSVCFHSMLYYHQQMQKEPSKFDLPVHILDIICFSWFVFELILRIVVFYPRRIQFFFSFSNWIDIISVCTYIPHFINRSISSDYNEPIEILSSLRMLRLFRFFRLSSGLQVLKHTMVASSKEMLLLLLLLMIPVTLFATIVYFCERKVENTKFKTIPESFWWAIVTMTTVGYGDMAPKTSWGKIFGAVCSSCSLLILALPVSIIGNNFSLFYSYAQARLKLPKKSHNALVGAANVLVAEASNSDPSPTFDNDSDGECSNAGDINNLHASDGNLTSGKIYRRDRLSLYAGGVVRSSRRPLRARSAGVTGLSSDSDREQRDSLARSSNLTGTTDADSQSDQNVDSDEKKAQNSQNEAEQGLALDHSKSNGTVSGKPPLSGKRRPRSGSKKVHPVIQVTEDDNTDQGVDNEVFTNGLDVNDNTSPFSGGARTPPIHELGKLNNSSMGPVRGPVVLNKPLEVYQMQQFKPPTVKALNLRLSEQDSKQNGTVSVSPMAVDPVNDEEDSVDINDVSTLEHLR